MAAKEDTVQIRLPELTECNNAARCSVTRQGCRCCGGTTRCIPITFHPMSINGTVYISEA